MIEAEFRESALADKSRGWSRTTEEGQEVYRMTPEHPAWAVLNPPKLISFEQKRSLFAKGLALFPARLTPRQRFRAALQMVLRRLLGRR